MDDLRCEPHPGPCERDDVCVGAIAGVDMGLGDNVWLLGDYFMKNVYSVFSIDKNAVGFAQLK
ncbi:hypothetical protein C8Q80DRAFT_1272253 [Daedaleopsis nitida]|nr:hypothetical protein C8Q80DRAFT_1272253 [Daedaleopsis nitida]